MTVALRSRTIESLVSETLDQATSDFGERKQFTCPANVKTWTDPRTVLGHFYERMGAALVGGELCNDRLNGRFCPCDQGVYQPDVETQDAVYEVKGAYKKSTSNLKSRQIKGGASLDKPLQYFFFKHSLEGIRSWENGPEELFLELANHTLYGIVVPFSLVKEMHDLGQELSGETDRFVYNGSRGIHGDGYIPCTCIQQGTFTTLLREPEEICSYFNIQASSQVVRSQKMSVRVGNQSRTIQPFPIRVLTMEN